MSTIPTTTTPPLSAPGLASSNLPPNPVGASPTTTTTAPIDLPTKLQATANVAPDLSPSATVGLATTATTNTDAAINAYITNAVKQASQVADQIRGFAPSQQIKLWNAASVATKSLLSSSGYHPPSAQDVAPPAGGFWHGVLSAGDVVKHDVYSAADTVLRDNPLTVFWNAGAAGVNHLIRTALYNSHQWALNNMEAGGSGEGLGGWLNELNPHSLIEAWGATQNAPMSYDPLALHYVQNEMGITGQTLQLAKQAASGMSLQSILASFGGGTSNAAAKQAAYLTMTKDSKFQDAVNLLKDSHLTWGQAAFGGLSQSQIHSMFPQYNTLIGNVAQTVIGAGGTAAMIGAAGEGSAAEEGAGLLAKGASALRVLGVGGTGAAQALALTRGSTVDAATTISPFGTPIHPLSGVADGIISWYVNPVQVGLANRAGLNASHGEIFVRAMKNPDEVIATYATSPAYNRYAVRAAKAMTTPFAKMGTDVVEHDANGLAVEPNVGEMSAQGFPITNLNSLYKEYYPSIAKAVATGDNQKIGEAVGTMLGSDTGMLNIASGRMSYWFKDATRLPRVTLGEDVLARLRGLGRSTWGGERFNMAATSPTEVATDLAGADAVRAANAADATTQEGRAARMMRRAVNLTPLGPIDVADARSVTQLERYMAQALPQHRIADILNYYENTDPALQGERMKIARAAQLETMRVFLRPEQDPVAAAFLQREEGRMSFSTPGGALYANPLNPDGPPIEMAIIEPQLSTRVFAPGIKELNLYSKKAWLMRQVEMSAGHDLFDHFMSRQWRPGMILRPGLGIRMSGEEGALFLLRSGTGAYLRGRIASSLTDVNSIATELKSQRAILEAAARAGDEHAQEVMRAQHLFSAVTSHIPQEARDLITTPSELIASVHGWRTVQWVQRNLDAAGEAGRALGRNLVGQEILDSMKFYQDHSTALENSFATELSAIGQHNDPYFGESDNFREASMWKDQAGLPLQLVRDGVWKTRAADDPLYLERYHFALSQLRDSRWSRIALAAFKRGGYNGQVQAVEDELRARGIWNDLAVAMKEGDTASATKLRASLDAHETLLRKFPVAFQTKGGYLTTADSALANQAFRDWATAIVDNANRHVMTLAIQDDGAGQLALPAAGEDGAAQHLNPRPIVMPDTQAPLEPFRVASIDRSREGTLISPTFENSAYEHIAPGEVRLFTPVNVTDTGGYNPVENPGRFWTPSFQQASTIASTEGRVYQVDVKMEDLLSDFKIHGEGNDNLPNAIYEAQHPEAGQPIKPPEGNFESGRIMYGSDVKNAPETLADMLGRGSVPDLTQLRRLPTEILPDSIKTPDMVMATPPSMWEKAISKGFYNAVGRPLDYLVRQPMFNWQYHVALQEAKALIEARGIPDESGQLAHDLAEERAVTESSRYIHNPHARSQFSTLARNFAPFWFAQEQFYKRWFHLFGTYPEAWYKLSMTVHALRSVGFVYTDQYGKNAFNYPGSGIVDEALMHLPFFQSLPVGVGWSSEVNQLNPSLTNGLLPVPSFGPLLSIPVDVAGWVSPKYFGGLAQFLQGPDGAPINVTNGRAQRLLDEILPTVLSRLGQWGITDATASSTSASGAALFLTSMIDAARLLMVGGHGLTAAQQANPLDVQHFEDRLKNWTENMMLLRTAFGFVAPGTPNLAFNTDPNGLAPQLFALMATMPYTQAVAAFVAAHPDATAYDIFATTSSMKNQSGTYIPVTVQAGQWLADNSAFVNAYPQLAPYAMPADTANGLFSSPTYQKEINLGMRQRRSLDSWVNDYYYTKGANTYYGLEQWFWAAGGASTHLDASNAQQALGVTQTEAATKLGLAGQSPSQIKQAWDTWKTGFMKANPLFTANYQDRSSQSLERRTSIVNALQTAISTGNLPDNEWSKHVEELMSVYSQVQSFYTQTQGNSAYATQRSQYKQALNVIGTQMSKMYPDIAPIWNSVLSKQIGVVN